MYHPNFINTKTCGSSCRSDFCPNFKENDWNFGLSLILTFKLKEFCFI